MMPPSPPVSRMQHQSPPLSGRPSLILPTSYNATATNRYSSNISKDGTYSSNATDSYLVANTKDSYKKSFNSMGQSYPYSLSSYDDHAGKSNKRLGQNQGALNRDPKNTVNVYILAESFLNGLMRLFSFNNFCNRSVLS